MSKYTMMLRIPEPTRFYCEADEDHFFSWLQGIAAVKAFVGTPDGLDLNIEMPIDQLSFYELVGLMTRYQLDKKCLRPLCDGHKDPWFSNQQNYWYESVFG
ncbi:hypothetical protein [Acidovorax sp. NCPPB 3576]|uniref:hypothetical protein n=1 Tax=Acidovorax sp. NCPPB 3576 TaxID=2940488 RepID=UPI0023493A24|nr:hypothetical protein [Acidovorax sp. NCPPB 3576]WCM87697.1 hypothetical protein M5C98_20510 [Acidovorax sp. NCPPB 3576]